MCPECNEAGDGGNVERACLLLHNHLRSEHDIERRATGLREHVTRATIRKIEYVKQ